MKYVIIHYNEMKHKGLKMKFELFGYTIEIEKKALANTEEMPQDLQEALKVIQKYGVTPPPSAKKVESAKRATEIRVKRVKEKINNAINLLRLENKEITPYSVAKTAGISYNTAKKYLEKT